MLEHNYEDPDLIDFSENVPPFVPAPDSGISSGKGILGSMLSWIRRTGANNDHVTLNQVPAATPPDNSISFAPISATSMDGHFDSAEMMRGIRAYHDRYHSYLYGAGLVIGLETKLPPPLFPVVAKMPGFTGAKDTFSFLASDYESNELAREAVNKLIESNPGSEKQIEALNLTSPRQMAWLVNAACVRGALRMDVFAEGIPEFVLDAPTENPIERAVRAIFQPQSGGAEGRMIVPFSGFTKPLSLGRDLRNTLSNTCIKYFEESATTVADEFQSAIVRPTATDESDSDFDFSSQTSDLHIGIAIHSSPALGRMKRSYVAFSNLSGVIAADKAFIAGIDRQALSDAIRHSRSGFSLAAYVAHTDIEIRSSVELNRRHGALAFAHYESAILKKLTQAHCLNQNNLTVSVSPYAKVKLPFQNEDLTSLFCKTMESEMSEHCKEVFRSMSPRYLSTVILGAGGKTPLVARFDVTRTRDIPITAGLRLARAFNNLVGETGNSNKLPWTAILSHQATVDLMFSDCTDEAAVQGLATIFGVANAFRVRKGSQGDLSALMPVSALVLAAPESNRVGSMLQLMGRTTSPLLSSANRTTLNLIKELVLTQPPVKTYSSDGNKALEWRPRLARLEDDDPFSQEPLKVVELAVCSSDKTWARISLNVTSGLHPKTGDSDELKCIVSFNEFEFIRVLDAQAPEFSTRKNDERHSGLTDISDCGIKKPILRTYPVKAKARKTESNNHRRGIQLAWSCYLKDLTQSHPLEMACLFGPVAQKLTSKTASASHQLQPLSKAKSFRLARVCMARDNGPGIEVVVGLSKDPMARTASGISLLDIALEGKGKGLVARAALKSIAEHPVCAGNSNALAEYVQSSLGKLIERHPSLLPMAVGYGVHLDETALLAWNALHPKLKSHEAEAAITAARMRDAITRAISMPADMAPASQTAPRRRMGV